MQLKHLYTNFAEQDEEGQRTMVRNYRAQRDITFTEIQQRNERKRSTSTRTPAVQLSDEEKALIKKLGITQAQLKLLRAMEDT